MQFKLHHVGIAVRELGQAADRLSCLFSYDLVSGPFDDPLQRVSVSFLSGSSGDAAQIELIAPFGENSPIQSMLNRGATGPYHLCFETEDIVAAVEHLQRQGCVVISQPLPAVAFQGRRIAWIYTPDRQLFELLEAEATR